MIRTTIILLVCLVSASIGYCQEKFIEIEVSDTIQVTPDAYVYRITMQAEMLSVVSGHDSDQSKMKTFDKDRLIETVNRFPAFQIIDDKYQSLNSSLFGEHLVTLVIKTNSKASIQNLKNELAKNEEAKAIVSLTELIVNDPKLYELKLKQTLIEKSKIKAEETAQLINRKIGEIYGITAYEFKDTSKKETESGWTGYPTNHMIKEFYDVMNADSTKKAYSQKIRVTYLMK